MTETNHVTSDLPGPSRSRRRYMPGSTRSKTIELGTLSEIEEDLYQNRKDVTGVSPLPTTAKDDSCVGSVRHPTKGSVRSLARHLSERQRVDKDASTFPAAKRARQELESEPSEEFDRIERPILTEPSNVPNAMDNQQKLQNEPRVQRTMSERREHVREPYTKWSPSYSEDRWCPQPHPSLSEYHHMRTPSVMSRNGSVAGPHPISRSASMMGRMLVYDPRTMSLVDPGLPVHDPRLSEGPIPLWFPPPAPIYIPLGAQMPQYPHKIARPRKPRSVCSEVCCGGIAQLLWTIISIVLMGVVATLVLALFYV